MIPVMISILMITSDQDLVRERTQAILRLSDLDDSIARSAYTSGRFFKEHSRQYNEVISRSSMIFNYYNNEGLIAQSNLNYALARRYHKRGRVNVYQAKQLVRKIQDLNQQLGYDIDDFSLRHR